MVLLAFVQEDRRIRRPFQFDLDPFPQEAFSRGKRHFFRIEIQHFEGDLLGQSVRQNGVARPTVSGSIRRPPLARFVQGTGEYRFKASLEPRINKYYNTGYANK